MCVGGDNIDHVIEGITNQCRPFQTNVRTWCWMVVGEGSGVARPAQSQLRAAGDADASGKELDIQ